MNFWCGLNEGPKGITLNFPQISLGDLWNYQFFTFLEKNYIKSYIYEFGTPKIIKITKKSTSHFLFLACCQNRVFPFPKGKM